jgi:DNA-binding NarL/FixJ family response regulator
MPEGSTTVPGPRANIAAPVYTVADRPPRGPLSVGPGRTMDGGTGLTESTRGQPWASGLHSVSHSDSNSSADRGHGDWDAPPTAAGGSTPAWERTAGRDPLKAENILIIDDCTLYRENLAAIFTLNGIAVPSVAWDLPSLVVALEETEPSVVLFDIGTRDCALLLRAARDLSPNVRIIVLGASENDESEIVACAEAGVAGYHMRTDSLEDLLVLIRKVAAGESSCPPRVSAILLRRLSALASQRQPPVRELALTAREIQILRMLELGRSNRDIAAQLAIAVHTVKNHVHSLLTKLGVSTRAEAAAVSRTIR